MVSRNALLLFSLLFLASAAHGQSADLSVVAREYNPRDVTLAIANYGPEVARNAVLTIEVPPGLEVEPRSVFPCDATARPVRCSLGDAPVYDRDATPPGVLYLGFLFRAPLADATYVVTFTVSSDVADPKAENNSVSLTFVTRIEADMGVLLETEQDRTDPGGTAGFRAFVCNDVGENKEPSNIRIDFTATNATVESITPPAGVTCTIDGASAVCTSGPMPGPCFQGTFDTVVRASSDRGGAPATLAMHVTTDVPDRTPENNRKEVSVAVYRWLAVQNTAGGGPGSLRDAIEQANALCSPGPCRIVFEIAGPVPAEGWFTIIPAEPLPEVTADRVTIEGSRQTAFTGDTNPNGPEIAIDGRLARRGLKMRARCEGVVDGLALGHFSEDQGLWFATAPDVAVCGNRPDRREVTANHIGVDPSGLTPWPNLRGLRADFADVSVRNNVISHNTYSGIWMWRGQYLRASRNRIEHNGASGIFLGPEVNGAGIDRNTISFNREMGVAAARGARWVDVRTNSMKDNGGLGIDWGLDGVSPVNADDRNGAPSNAPVILSAVYDPATDVVTVAVTVQSTPLGSYFTGGAMEFFINDGPDADGERYIGALLHPDTNGPITLKLRGDYRGKWLNATWTRVHWAQIVRTPGTQSIEVFPAGTSMTSEFSNSVLVQ